MATVGAIAPWLNEQYTDDNGVPLSTGYVKFTESGLVTLKDTFSTSDLDPGGVNANPLPLDSSGRPPVAVFLESGLYSAFIYDNNPATTGVLIKTIEGFGTPAAEAPTGLGRSQSAGARLVTDGYTVLATDLYITVDGSGGADPTTINLGSSVTRQQQLAVQNYGTTAVKLLPTGTVNGQAFYTLNANVGTNFPGAVLLPDTVGAGNWLVISSHTS